MTSQQHSSISSFKLLLRRILIPWILAVAVFSALGDLFITQILVKKAQLSHSFKIAKLLGPKSGLNAVPIFGPSMARNAYYCDSLSQNYYNYAMENAGFEIVELLLKLEYEKKGKQTPIIVDYHFRFLEPDTSDKKRTINITTYLPFIISNKEVRDFIRTNGRLCPHHRIPGLRFFGAYPEYGKDLFAEFFHPRKDYHRGGVFNKKAPPKEQFERLIAYRFQEGKKQFIYTPEFAERFEKLIEDHPDRQLLLVGSPRHHSVLEMLTNYDDMLDYADMLATKYDNVKVFIFQTDLEFDPEKDDPVVKRDGPGKIFKVNYPDEYYKDTGHLSLIGARVFSATLREVLRKEGLLVDHPIKKKKKKTIKREKEF